MKKQIVMTIFGIGGLVAPIEAEAVTEKEVKTSETPAAPAPSYYWGGNLVQGYTFNPSNPSDGYNGTVTWTDRANEYQLNQAWTYFEVPTDTSKKAFDVGGRVDLEFGSNYRWATSAGFEDKVFKTNTGQANTGTVNSSQYGLALTQAYLDFAYKSTKLRVGHIISPVGFYTVDTTQNFFSVIPYTYQYGEPFTHWGAWLYWTVNDKLTLSGGVTHGGDNFDGSGTGAKLPGFLGTVSYIFDDKSTFDWVVHISKEYNYTNSTNSTDPTLTVTNGAYNGAAGLYSWRYFQTLVYKRDLTNKLQWVAQSDLGIQQVADVQAAAAGNMNQQRTAAWYGLNTYFYYKLLETLTLGLNLEWFRDSAGVRVGAALPTASYNGSTVAGMGTAGGGRANYIGNFFQVTFGPKWQVQKNLFLRALVRYDYFDGIAVNGPNSLPFGGGSKRDQAIIGLDMGFTF